MALGDILIVGNTTDRVYRYNNGAWDAGIAVPTVEANPDGVAVDPVTGDILIVGFSTDQVYRYSNGAWDAGIAVPAGEANPRGVAVDPVTGDILIVGNSADRVYRYSNGAWDAGIAVPAAETSPQGVTVDPATGDILILGFSTDRVYRYSNGAWDAGIAVPAAETTPRGVAVDPVTGDILIVGNSADRVYRYSNGAWDAGIPVPAGEANPVGVAVDGFENAGLMAQQTIVLTGDQYVGSSTLVRWTPGGGPGAPDRVLLDVALTDGQTRYFANVQVGSNGEVGLHFTDPRGEQPSLGGDDLSQLFRTSGGFDITVGDFSLSVNLDGDDEIEPYVWTPSNSNEVTQFYNNVFALPGSPSATLILRDFPSLPVADAPAVVINAISNGDENTTVQLSATITGGTYDALAYAWSVNGGVLDDAAAESPVWTRPAVSADTDYTISLTVTASGDGTTAADGSSDTADDTATATVENAPVVTTDTDIIYILSAAQPTRPTGGTGNEDHLPAGWSRSEPDPTEAQGVWGSQRTRSFTNGVFTSATIWGSVFEEEERLLAFADLDAHVPISQRDSAALIERTGTGNVLYADSDRGGTDSPLEGELGIGTGNTVMSRIAWNGSTLVINDNDNPVALAIEDFFDTGGEGADYNLFVQTSSGFASESVSATINPGGTGLNRLRFTNFFQATVDLLNGIAVGDRFIIGFDQGESVTVFGDAAAIEWSASLSQATGFMTPPPVFGDAQAIEWSSSLAQAAGSFEEGPDLITFSFIIPSLATQSSPGVLIPPEFVEGGATAYLITFYRVGASFQFYISSTEDGDGNVTGPQMVPGWVEYVEAIKIEAPDGDVLLLSGPNHPDSTFQDATEPYFWTPSTSTNLAGFYSNHLGESVTVTLTAEVEVAQTPNGDATPIEWEASLAQATGRISAVRADASPIIWEVSLLQATGRVSEVRVDATPLEWNVSLSRSTASVAVNIDGSPFEWEASLSQATGRVTAVTADATPIIWSVSLAQTTGSFVEEVRVDAVPITWNASLAQATGEFSEELELVNFNVTGLDVEALAIIEAGTSTTLYADSDRGGTQTASDLDANSDLTLTFEGANSLISRIRVLDSGARVNLNDNDNPDVFSFQDLFGGSNSTSAYTLYIQTSAGVVSSDDLGAVSGRAVNFNFSDSDDQTFLNNIVAGERVIIGIARQLVRADATPIVWSVSLSQAMSVVEVHADATPIEWSMVLAQATGRVSIVRGDAAPIEWSTVLSPATGVVSAVRVDAVPIAWSVSLTEAIGRVPEIRVDASPIEWSAFLAEATGRVGITAVVDSIEFQLELTSIEATAPPPIDFPATLTALTFGIEVPSLIVTEGVVLPPGLGNIEQEFILGSSIFFDAISRVYVGPSPSVSFNPLFIEGGHDNVKISTFTIESDGTLALLLQTVGIEFKDEILALESLITLRSPGLEDVTIAAPGYAGNLVSDSLDAYIWTPANANEVQTFFQGLTSASIVTLFFDTEPIPNFEIAPSPITLVFDIPAIEALRIPPVEASLPVINYVLQLPSIVATEIIPTYIIPNPITATFVIPSVEGTTIPAVQANIESVSYTVQLPPLTMAAAQDTVFVGTLSLNFSLTVPSIVAENVPEVFDTVPDAPLTLGATPGNQEATLYWSDAVDGGSPLLHYEYRVNSLLRQGGGSWNEIPNSAPGEANTNSYIVRNLQNNSAVLFELRAVNAIGNGGIAEASITSSPVPTAPVLLSAAPGDAEVVLTWEASISTTTDLKNYEYRVDTSAWIPTNSTELSILIGGLINGQTYRFRMRGLNDIGHSVASNELTATPIGAGTPRSFSVSPGTGEVTLTWGSPPAASNPIHTWDELAPLHTGIEQASPLETNRLEAGSYTLGIKAIDTSGIESRNANLIQVAFGDRRVMGLDGEDGNGVEYVFAATQSSIQPPVGSRPLASWTFDQALTADITIGGETYGDGAPTDYNASNPFLHRYSRSVMGTPEVGAVVDTPWKWDGVSAHYGRDGRDGQDGQDGQDGEDGDAGSRARGDFYRSVVASGWSNEEANLATPGDNVISDTVTLFQTSGSYVETRTWQGTSWIAVDQRIDGNILFPGSVTVNALAANSVNLGSATVFGTLTAEHIDADVQNALVLFDGSVEIAEDTSVTISLAPGVNIFNWDTLFFVFLLPFSSTSQWFTTASFPVSSLGVSSSTVYLMTMAPHSNRDGEDNAPRFKIWSNTGGSMLTIQEVGAWRPGIHQQLKAITAFKNPNIGVSPPPPPPPPPPPGETAVTANAGSDKNVESGGSVQLTGSASVQNGSGSTTYSWSRVSGIGGSLSNSNIAQPTFNAPTVTSDRDIVYRLTATNNGVSDTDDVTITVMPASLTAPGLPSNLRVTGTTENSITLACNAPTSGGAPTLYRWRYSTNSFVSNSDPERTSSGTSVTITGLSEDTDYWMDVQAENSIGISGFTTDVMDTTDAGTGLPDAVAPNVTIAAVSSVDEDDIQSLSASVSGGTYDALSYAWSVVSGGGSISGSGSSVTYNPPDVTSNTAVTVRCTVTATGNGTNAATGTSDTDSDDEVFTVNMVTPDPNVPGVPRNFVATRMGQTITTDFDHPTSGGLPTQYRVQFYSENTNVWLNAVNGIVLYPGSSSTSTYTGPVAGFSTARVRAENSNGNSAWETATINVLPAPSQAPGVPTNVSANQDTSNGDITTTFGAPTTGGAATLYRLEQNWTIIPLTFFTFATHSAPGTYTDMEFQGRLASMVRVRAENSIGVSAWVTVLAGQVPGVPTNVGFVRLNSENVRTTWAAPGTGGLPTTYRINLWNPNSMLWAVGSISTVAYPGTSLDNFHTTATRGRVRAENQFGNSAWVES